MIDHHGAPGVLVPLDSPYMEAAARAIEHAFGRRPVFTREGGSIPIVATFHEALEADALLLGWGQDDDNTHSPNEKFSPGRLPSRHQGQRQAVGRIEQSDEDVNARIDASCKVLTRRDERMSHRAAKASQVARHEPTSSRILDP